MAELFENEVKQIPVKQKKFYKAGDGKFTDPLTARIDHAEKQCRIHKNNESYYKRQCERLQRELLDEIEKNKKLRAALNVKLIT